MLDVLSCYLFVSHSCVSINVVFGHVLDVMFIRLSVMFCVYKLSCGFVHFVGYNHVKRSSWELCMAKR